MTNERGASENEAGSFDAAFFDEASYVPVIRRSDLTEGVAHGTLHAPIVVVSGSIAAARGVYRYAPDWRIVPNVGDDAVPTCPDPRIIEQEIANGDLL